MNPATIIADCLAAALYVNDKGEVDKLLLETTIKDALRAMRDHCADVARDRPYGAEGWIRRVEV